MLRQRVLPSCMFLVAACSSFDASQSSDVVEGRDEHRVRAAGYLLREGDEVPYCTATLIAPAAVVTAAHCVDQRNGRAIAFGVGEVAAAARRPIVDALSHPVWDPEDSAAGSGPRAWLHDVAVLRLDAPVVGVAPLEPGVATEPGCGARGLGYGRTTPGGPNEVDGYTGARKSTAMCIDAVATGMVYAHGADGGLCWGDSGGPLLVGWPGAVVGVLHGFAGEDEPRCETGNPVAYTSLDAERDFVSCALAQKDAAPPMTPFDDVRCHFVEPFLPPLVGRKLVKPFPDGGFHPEATVTRREFARLVVAALAPTPKLPAKDFPDVIEGSADAAALELAYRAGFLAPSSDGKLLPAAPLARLDLVRGLVRGMTEVKGGSVALASLIDVDGLSAAERADVAAAVASGLVVSYPDARYLRPDEPATRAELAATLVQALVLRGELAPLASSVIVAP
ncbi:MAG: trypsin-like serine protease [Deltaproteobacteria bacterium]|nr:trypsin-like serine protease [Deltaproteobacteria bacterium]